MKFNYQARTKTGEIQSGVVEASSKEAAFEALKSHDLYVTVIEEAVSPIYAKKIKLFERVSNKDLVVFSRELAIMFKSRIPLVDVLQTLARQTKNSVFKESISKIAEEVEGGSSLSNALSLFPKLFSSFYIHMVRAGEASGKLTDVFLYLANYLEKEYSFRSKIRGAMIYPAFVVFVFLIVASIIVLFIIPQLTEVLKESGQDLPLITRIAIGLADFLKHWVWLLILILIGAIFGVYRFAKTESGKKFFDHNLLKVPLLGAFLRKLYLSRLALNLSTLIAGGLPIVQALDITSQVVGNDVYKNIIEETKNEVRKGETISSVLEKYPDEVSPLFHQMTVVGERTGTLDSSLNNVVMFYQEDVDRALNDFIKLLEPILIITLAVFVGGLMAAVLFPMYSFSGSI